MIIWLLLTEHFFWSLVLTLVKGHYWRRRVRGTTNSIDNDDNNDGKENDNDDNNDEKTDINFFNVRLQNRWIDESKSFPLKNVTHREAVVVLIEMNFLFAVGPDNAWP